MATNFRPADLTPYLLPLAIAACAWLALGMAAPPAPLAADAPAGVFSATRAQADLAVIARAPHPIGSAENARVRDHLVARLTALGFETAVQRTPVHYAIRDAQRTAFAFVENVVGVKRGSGGGPALALMAHYDSRWNAPGAGDDGAGTAAILEIARALGTTPLARDLVVVLTDGEESGLYGAQAFVRQHPLARDIGLIINLEARGSRGPALLFETSSDNAALIQGAAQALDRPVTSSLFYEAYRLMPNDTDLTATKAAGIAGLNIALVGGFFDYHSPTDTPENFSPATLQHLGEYGLVLARHFGMRELPATADQDLVYFDVLGRVLVYWPVWLGHALTLLAVLGFAALVLRARATGRASLGGSARGALGFLLVVVSIALLANGLFAALGGSADSREPRFWWGIARLEWQTLAWSLLALGATALALHGYARRLEAHHILARAGSLLLVFLAGGALDWQVALAIAVVAGAELALFRYPHQPWELALGALALWTTIAVAASVVVPSATQVFTLPLLGALAAHHWAVTRAPQAPATQAGLILGAAWGLVTLAFLVQFVHLGLGYAAPGMPAALVVLGLGLVVPVVVREVEMRRQVLAVGAVLAGVAMLVWHALVPPWSARHPLPQDLFLIDDRRSGEQLFASSDRVRDAWQLAQVPADAREETRERLFPGSTAPLWVAPVGEPLVTGEPRIEVLSVETSANGTRTHLRFVPPAGALMGYLWFQSAQPYTRVSLVGHGELPVAAADDQGQQRIAWHAIPTDGVELEFIQAEAAASSLRSLSIAPGFPAPFQDLTDDRAPASMAGHYGWGAATVVIAEHPLSASAATTPE